MKQWNYLPLLIFTTALALRLFYIFEIADNPFFTSPVVDAHTYAQQAEIIAAGHWLNYTSEPFWQPPLYPWLLGAVYRLAGTQFFLVIRIVQAFFGAVSCVLLYLIGRRLFSPQVGLLAAAALTLYGTAIYFDAELLPASLAVLLFLVVLLAALAAKGRQTRWYWIIPGTLLGVAALNVPTILSLVPCMLIWIYADSRAGGNSKIGLAGSMGLFCAGLALAVAPVTLRNYAIGDDFVLISWNAGVNFYLGNNPEYPQTTQIRPGQAWLDLMDRAQSAGFANGSENSRFFFAEAWNFIRRQPAAYGQLLATKFTAFWNGDEVGRNQNIYYLRNYSRLLSAVLWKHTLAFPFGLIAPLAIAGFLLAIPHRGAVWFLLGAMLSYAAGVILFFVTARYRLPLVPGLLLLASFAVFRLAAMMQNRQPSALVWSAAVGLLLIGTNSGSGTMDMEGDAEVYYNLGHAHIEKKRFGKGIHALEQAARLVPNDADILFSLGTAYELTGAHRRARRVLSQAAQLYPGRLDIRLNLGNAYFNSQLYEQAAAEYQVVLETRPDHVETLRSAARAVARAGRAEMAITYYERLRRLTPEDIEPYLALGYFYTRTDQPEQALANYQRALQLDPEHLTALLESGLLHLQKDEFERAREIFQLATRFHPRASLVYDHLGKVYERQGQWQAAIQAYRQVIQLDPHYPDIHRRLARLYQQKEKPAREP